MAFDGAMEPWRRGTLRDQLTAADPEAGWASWSAHGRRAPSRVTSADAGPLHAAGDEARWRAPSTVRASSKTFQVFPTNPLVVALPEPSLRARAGSS